MYINMGHLIDLDLRKVGASHKGGNWIEGGI